MLYIKKLEMWKNTRVFPHFYFYDKQILPFTA